MPNNGTTSWVEQTCLLTFLHCSRCCVYCESSVTASVRKLLPLRWTNFIHLSHRYHVIITITHIYNTYHIVLLMLCINVKTNLYFIISVVYIEINTPCLNKKCQLSNSLRYDVTCRRHIEGVTKIRNPHISVLSAKSSSRSNVFS